MRMHKIARGCLLPAAIAAAVLLGGCEDALLAAPANAQPTTAAEADVTTLPEISPTVAVVEPSATALPDPTSAPQPSATPLPEPTATGESTQPTVSRVKIFLVALEDNGASGKMIGCGDSLVSIERDIAPTQEPIKAALEQLFAIKDQFLGESGLYNALYQSNLTVASVSVEGGTATVQLSGTHALGGVCDMPRFGEQITATILQFPGVQQADVYINGQRLADILSLKG